MSEHSPLTPYAASQVTNRLLAAAGSDREIAPQMLYGYAKRNVIATTDGPDDKVYFDGDAFAVWVAAYVKAVISGQTGKARTDYDALAAEYAS